MPGQHAVLSPSAAGRWLQCPASVRVVQQVPKPPESPYAHEGTVAHALAEIRARWYFGQIDDATYDREYEAWRLASELDVDTIGEMTAHVDGYIELIEERLALYPYSQVMFEKRVNTGVESCWGTSDTVIVSPEHVEIIDLKYGMGVQVEAQGNPQLRLYGLGALDEFGDLLGHTEVVRCTVYQPRIFHVDTEEISAADLRAWREGVVKPAAAVALHDENAPFGPSESACRWCPAAGECRARVEVMAGLDFGDPQPDLVSDEELAALYVQLKDIRAFADAMEAAALRRAYSEGKSLPGLKVVLAGGRRAVVDPEGAIKALKAEELVEDQFLKPPVPRALKGLGDLEKLLGGKNRFAAVLGPYVEKGEGRPALVPETDKRPAVNPNIRAASDFAEEDL